MEDNSPQTCQEVGVTSVLAAKDLADAPSSNSHHHMAVSSCDFGSEILTDGVEESQVSEIDAEHYSTVLTGDRSAADRSAADRSAADRSATGRSVVSTSWTYRLVSAGLAFSVWGGWGYFVNSQETAPTTSPMISGLLHGLFSSMVTIVMLTSVTWLYRRFAAAGVRMLIPAVTTSLVTGSCITTAHLMIGTANVPATVIPGLVVAFCFNMVTTQKLHQADQAAAL